MVPLGELVLFSPQHSQTAFCSFSVEVVSTKHERKIRLDTQNYYSMVDSLGDLIVSWFGILQ